MCRNLEPLELPEPLGEIPGVQLRFGSACTLQQCRFCAQCFTPHNANVIMSVFVLLFVAVIFVDFFIEEQLET